MTDFIVGFALGICGAISIISFLTPWFVFKMTLNFNKLTKFGILVYFSTIFVCLWTYLHLFNEKIVESAGHWFEIICGISYLIFIAVLVLPDTKHPKIYIEEEKAGN